LALPFHLLCKKQNNRYGFTIFTNMNLVTGGTGILGMRLLYDLSKTDDKTRTIKRKNANLNLVKEVFQFYGDTDGTLFEKIEWVEGDILDILSIEKAIQGCSRVYHCAAKVSFIASENEAMLKTNVEGTANLVNVCLDNNIEKLCYVSSVAAIGRAKDGDEINERTKWKTNSLNSNYGISKYLAEREVWRGIEEGLSAVIINPTVILGAAQNNQSSGSLFRNLIKGSSFYTSGSNGFVDVRNVSEAMIKLMQSDSLKERYVLVGENLSYKKILEQSSISFHHSKPKFKASKWLLEISWRLAYLVSLINRKKPFLTKETARTSDKSYYYSNQKIKDKIAISFYSVKDSFDFYSRFYLKK
jgi:dihydroflavonol-4-reductase